MAIISQKNSLKLDLNPWCNMVDLWCNMLDLNPFWGSVVQYVGPQCSWLGATFAQEHILGICSWKNEHGVLKSVYLLILKNFFKNGSPGQTTMLMRRASKFCVKPRSPFSEISHHDPETIGKPPSIVSWPECQC